MSVLVRPAVPADVARIVSVHQSAFEGFLLTQLGTRFLTLFYRAFLEQEGGQLLVAVDAAGQVIGLLAGIRTPSVFFATLRRRRAVSFAFAAVPALVRHPLIVAERLWAAIRYRGDRPVALPGYWLLSSLGVAKFSIGAGAGGALVTRFCEDASRAGAPGVYLLTDASENEATQHFYARHGFAVYGTQKRSNGRQLLILTRSFSQ